MPLTYDQINKAMLSHVAGDDQRTMMECLEEWERQRSALAAIKSLVSGEKVPNWTDPWATTCSRVKIADICDQAMPYSRVT